MERLNNVQRATIIAALKKDLENEEKIYRQMADADILDVNAKTGAKTFEVALETDTRKVPIGTASVVTKEGEWKVTDFMAWRVAASELGLVDYTFRVAPGHENEVMDALKDAGLDGLIAWDAKPVKDWMNETEEVAGRLVYRETGEAVEGVELYPGKTYTMLRPKSVDTIKKAALALYGTTPLALLEGGAE